MLYRPMDQCDWGTKLVGNVGKEGYLLFGNLLNMLGHYFQLLVLNGQFLCAFFYLLLQNGTLLAITVNLPPVQDPHTDTSQYQQ